MYGWADLPGDLLISIAYRFDYVEDMASFASVCSSWNAISKTVKKRRWTPSLPWVITPQSTEDQQSCRWTLSNVSTERYYNMVLPKTFDGRSWGCADGWVCTLNRQLEFSLFNPLTRVRLRLPSAHTFPMLWRSNMDYSNPDDWFERDCIISTLTVIKTPLNNELLVILIYNNAYMCFAKPGDSMWAALECYDYALDGFEVVECVVGFKGQIMVLYGDGKLTSLGKSDGFLTSLTGQKDFIARGRVLDKSKMDSIAEVCVPGDVDGVVSLHAYDTEVNLIMIESFGDLLVVLQYLGNADDRGNFAELLTTFFEVFKFDPQAKKWVACGFLDDVSLFLGDRCGISVRSYEYDICRPNCIYFIEAEHRPPESSGEFSVGIFDRDVPFMAGPISVGDESLYKFLFPFWFMPKPV